MIEKERPNEDVYEDENDENMDYAEAFEEEPRVVYAVVHEEVEDVEFEEGEEYYDDEEMDDEDDDEEESEVEDRDFDDSDLSYDEDEDSDVDREDRATYWRTETTYEPKTLSTAELDKMFESIAKDSYYCDLQKVAEKLAPMKGGGPEKLMVLSSFTSTMTWKLCDDYLSNSYELLVKYANFLHKPEIAEEIQQCYTRMIACETAPFETEEERIASLEGHLKTMYKTLMKLRIRKLDLGIFINISLLMIRPTTDHVLKLLEAAKVPIVVYTDEPEDVADIRMSLFTTKRNEEHTPRNFYMLGNNFRYDENNIACSFKRPLLHRYNKLKMTMEDPRLSGFFEQKSNLVLLGSSVDEAYDNGELPFENVFRIGFLTKERIPPNSTFEEFFEEMKMHYDLLIHGQGRMLAVKLIIEILLSKSTA